MFSTSQRNRRRRPQQDRAAERQTAFLDAAMTLFGKHGYEFVTMTAIAESAGASIGALYDYFPDKASVGRAVLGRLIVEADAYWSAVLADEARANGATLADVFVQALLDFSRERPAYLALLSAPIGFSRGRDARLPLRKTLANVLQSVNADLEPERALLAAEVIVALLKSLLAARKQLAAADRQTVTADVKALIAHYITQLAQ